MTPSSTQEWGEDELATVDLGDQRRNDRAELIVQRFAEKPGGSIPSVSEDHAEAKAIYRFLSNPAVEPDAIRTSLRDATVRRLEDERIVLVPQDTMCLNFGSHPETTGLGPTGGGDGSAGHGMFVHSGIAVSEDGVPLGLLHQQAWARDPDEIGSKHRRKERPIDDKESYRWLQTARAVEAAMPADKQLIQIADREGDIFELFAQPRREGSHLVIRAYRERRLEGTDQRLWAKVEQTPVAHEFTMLVHQSPHRTVRKAHLQLRYCSVTIRPPKNGVHDPALAPVTLTAIEVREVNPPASVTQPILWRLLTDLPTASAEDALRYVRYYELRWLIERYHYVLKSGCRIEDSQLRTADRLERLLVLCSAVALRLLWMTYSARLDGDRPCTVAFSDAEWQVLYRHRMCAAPPAEPPSLRDAVWWTAALGGFLGRTGDGEPGVKVLWRGLTRLQDIVVGFLLASRVVGNA